MDKFCCKQSLHSTHIHVKCIKFAFCFFYNEDLYDIHEIKELNISIRGNCAHTYNSGDPKPALLFLIMLLHYSAASNNTKVE